MKRSAKKLVISTLKEKATVIDKVYRNTHFAFQSLKKVLQDISQEYNEELKGLDKRFLLEYKDSGAFETELKVSTDLLIFHMHSNIFEFDKGHSLWKTSYVRNNEMSTYCGIINIYNFLSDSFKYNRLEDLGYLIARIYINKDNHYFVEGKRQLGFLYNNFGADIISKEAVRDIVESAMLYSLDFDLLVPPYDSVKITSVASMQERMTNSGVQTGKRLGFQFYKDDDQT